MEEKVMKKNIYEKPEMIIVRLQHQQVICTSFDSNGMGTTLQNEEVTSGWTKESNGSIWDEEW